MAKTDFKSVAEYIRAQRRSAQGTLRHLRQVIRKAIPNTAEGISYQIPAYKLDGRPVLFFAAWKEHYSLYPVSLRLYVALKDELSRYKVRKATLRIPWETPVPVGLIARIARFRAKEAAEGRKIKPSSGRR
jgi:uncharacterized protein YdhG (YjbR/CyaY superfamily)